MVGDRYSSTWMKPHWLTILAVFEGPWCKGFPSQQLMLHFQSCVAMFPTWHLSQMMRLCSPVFHIGNNRRLTPQVLRAFELTRPQNIFVWRCKTAWNTHANMRRYICLLLRSLGDQLRSCHVVLVVDCASVHIHASICRLVKQRGVRLVYVPAKMTPWLQPCDTHVFSAFKQALRQNWQRRKADVAGGEVNTVAWLEVICQTIQEVMPRSWQQAFQADGVVSHQRLMSAHLCRDLGLQQPPLPSAAPPTEQEFRLGKTARAAKAAAAPVPVAPVRTFRGKVVRTLD